LLQSEYRTLLDVGIELTDVCKIASDSGPEVGKGRFDIPRFVALVKRHRPRIVAFNGKRSPSVVAARAVGYGCQPARLADAAP
jgi:double-stranded uracil-DNA glycosylase